MFTFSKELNDDGMFLFERIIKSLTSLYGYSSDEAIELIEIYYSKFTNCEFCYRHGIPIQTMDFFHHIESRSMAERVHYYAALGNVPNESKLIAWQRESNM